MIYPDTDNLKWEQMYNLKSDPAPCECCGKPLQCTIPFAYGSVRGLKSAPHGCESRYDHTISRSLDCSEIETIREVFLILKGEKE